MGNASLLNLNGTKTIFSMLKDALKGTAFENYYIVTKLFSHRSVEESYKIEVE